MYVKVALKNARKAIGDYLIYITTVTSSVSLFYAFMSLSSSEYGLSVDESFDLFSFFAILKYSTIAITVAMVVLIAFVNNYMIKRRQREFANYILLGMNQNKVAFMFFIETLVMGFISIVIGIGLGSILAQGLTVIILETYKASMTLHWMLYKDTVLITFLFYLSLFSVVGIWNILKIKHLRLVNMLNAHRKTEYNKGTSFPLSVLAIVLSIIATIVAFYLRKSHVLIAILLGVFCFYGYFTGVTYIFVWVKDKVKRVSYRNTNLFFLGDMIFKMRSNALTTASVTLCLYISFLLFVLMPFLSNWSQGYLNYRMVADVQVYTTKNYIWEGENAFTFEPLLEYLDRNLAIDEYVTVDSYYDKSEDIVAFPLSKYNKMRSIIGEEPIYLEEGEYATHWHKAYVDQQGIRDYIAEHNTYKGKSREYSTNMDLAYTESIGEIAFNDDGLAFILPDQACEDLAFIKSDLFLSTPEKLTYEQACELEDYFYHGYEQGMLRIKTKEVNNITNIATAMKTQGIYGGIILFMICLTILSLQQLTDSMEHKQRFIILEHLGVDERGIHSIILRQLTYYFLVPIIIAGILFMFSMRYVVNKYRYIINAYIGNESFLIAIALAVLLVLLMLLAYYIATYLSFKANIERQ